MLGLNFILSIFYLTVKMFAHYEYENYELISTSSTLLLPRSILDSVPLSSEPDPMGRLHVRQDNEAVSVRGGA